MQGDVLTCIKDLMKAHLQGAPHRGKEIGNSRQQRSWLKILGITHSSTGKGYFVGLENSKNTNVYLFVYFTISKKKGKC